MISPTPLEQFVFRHHPPSAADYDEQQFDAFGVSGTVDRTHGGKTMTFRSNEIRKLVNL